MKNTFLLFLLMAGGNLFCQISISYSDYDEAFSPGATYLSYSTPMEITTVFVGEASSSAQYWDFSTYSFDYVAWSQAIDPSGAPLIGQFPSSNKVLYEKSWMEKADTIYIWNYKELQNEQLLIHGVSDESTPIFVYDPPAVQAKVPLTFGVEWMRERDSTFIMQDFYTISETWVKVDAFGTMKLPSGEYDCLRLVQNRMSILHSPGGIDTTYTRSYAFYAKGIVEVNIPTILPDQFNLTTITVNGFKYSKRDGQVGIADEKMTASNILSTYPNPFTAVITVQYVVEKQCNVKIQVIDQLGRVMKNLADREHTPGKYEVSFRGDDLPAGVYFSRMQMGNRLYINKIIKV